MRTDVLCFEKKTPQPYRSIDQDEAVCELANVVVKASKRKKITKFLHFSPPRLVWMDEEM